MVIRINCCCFSCCCFSVGCCCCCRWLLSIFAWRRNFQLQFFHTNTAAHQHTVSNIHTHRHTHTHTYTDTYTVHTWTEHQHWRVFGAKNRNDFSALRPIDLNSTLWKLSAKLFPVIFMHNPLNPILHQTSNSSKWIKTSSQRANGKKVKNNKKKINKKKLNGKLKTIAIWRNGDREKNGACATMYANGIGNV